MLNSPGTVDADYRGEVGVLLINLSQEEFVVNDGERIAQMVIARHEQGAFVPVEVQAESSPADTPISDTAHPNCRRSPSCCSR